MKMSVEIVKTRNQKCWSLGQLQENAAKTGNKNRRNWLKGQAIEQSFKIKSFGTLESFRSAFIESNSNQIELN